MQPKIINLEERQEFQDINEIQIFPEQPAKWITNNKLEFKSHCVACISRSCMEYKPTEIKDSEVLSEEFGVRGSLTYKTCVVDAISFDDITNTAVINEETCFACGVCVERCPVKAIYLTSTTAKVNIEIRKNTTIKLSSLDFYDQFLSNIRKARVVGYHQIPNQENLSILMERLKTLIEGKTKKIDINLFARNLLRSQGYLAISYLQGIQYSTIDVIARNKQGNQETLVVEVETTNAIETPRILLVALAIMVERHQLNDKNAKLLSLGFVFPNNREEFWNVLEDIKNVLDLDILFITIPSLIVLLWLAKNTQFSTFINQALSQDKRNLRTLLDIEKHLIEIPLGFERIFESRK